MNDRQWIATTAFAGVFVSAFAYIPVLGGLYALITVTILQGVYLGWQDVSATQSRIGAIAYSVGIFVGMPIMGLLLTIGGPGKLWGLWALIAILLGVVIMFISRFVRMRRAR